MRMWPSDVEHLVVAHIETADGLRLRVWRGSNLKRIKAAARAKYAEEMPGCRVTFGRSWSVNSYGAH